MFPKGALPGRTPRAASPGIRSCPEGRKYSADGEYEWRERPGTLLPGIWRIVCGRYEDLPCSALEAVRERHRGMALSEYKKV